MKFAALFLLISYSAFGAADQDKLPASFSFNNSRAVFADFHKATYNITYDVGAKSASAVALIELKSLESGHLIFDSLTEPMSITLDGQKTTATLTKTPNNETSVRVIDLASSAGLHTLKIQLPLTNMLNFTDSGVHHGMWFGDLEDRAYMERFLPSNFIFDRVPVIYNIHFVGADEQIIYSNGKVTKLSATDYSVEFSQDYNFTCQYFHTVPKGTTVDTRFTFKSIDGRDVPVVIYRMEDGTDQSAYLEQLKLKTLSIIDELEKDYGAWPHEDLTIYITASPTGGMEYSGATITSEKALGHELFHSYFARGVMPSDGNSGWIDEALARWRDNGYQSLTLLDGSSSMGNHGAYNRVTDRLAYSFGERFMALLDGTFTDKGGLKPFLREMIQTKTFDPLSNDDFMTLMNSFYGARTNDLFGRYILGESTQKNLISAPKRLKNDVHGQWTLEELKSFL